MTTPIKVPDIGATVDKVTFLKWLVEEGMEIGRGQKIAEIETDKAVVELESAATGTLLKKVASNGDEVAVGDVVAHVGQPGESVSESAEGEVESTSEQPASQSAPARVISKPRVSPMIRNLARQKGVDLDRVVGTGKDGMITRQDVLNAARNSN